MGLQYDGRCVSWESAFPGVPGCFATLELHVNVSRDHAPFRDWGSALSDHDQEGDGC